MTQSPGGYAGKTLRVDLSTGKMTVVPTLEKYRGLLGGTGIGYQAVWEEVPAGTQAFDPANILVFATGPLAGTGVPCNGRTAITTIFPTVWPKHLVGTGHMGGHFAAQLKYAGFDAVIVAGKADKPVWLYIHDGKAELRDAGRLWGQGIRRTNQEISQEIGAAAAVAAIGPAGENKSPMAVCINSVSHSAGGVGGVMGAKNLKAVAVAGTGGVRIAGDKGEWEKLVTRHLTLIGANNQHVVPAFPHPQAEFYNPGSRWVGAPGKRWEAAEPAVTIDADIFSLNRIAFRTNSAAFFLGDNSWRYTVRGNGCTACPIRCHTILKVPSVAAKYGVREIGQNTCTGLLFGRSFYKDLPGGMQGQTALEACVVGLHLADDLGIWCNYTQLQRDFIKLFERGTFRDKLPAKEYDSIPWDKYAAGDPAFLLDILPRIAMRRGELGEALSLGSGHLLERFGIPESEWTSDHATMYWKFGHPKHHANEDDGQCGVLINTQYNRDSQCHSHVNFIRNGLPVEVQKRLAKDLWGSEDAVDGRGQYTPANPHKSRRAKWAVLRKELHDSLGICNWMGPVSASPRKELGYAGDDSLEAKFYSLATGEKLTREELDKAAERIFTLHRALTMRDMNSKEMRAKHDLIPQWVFEDKKGLAAFSPGTIRMDRSDMDKALDYFYEAMGWDVKTGAPTKAALARLNLTGVADELGKRKLLPEG